VLVVATHRDWEMHRIPAMRRLLGGLPRTSRSVPLRGFGESDVAVDAPGIFGDGMARCH